MDTTWEPYVAAVEDELLFTQPSFDRARLQPNPNYNYILDCPSAQLPIPSPNLLNLTKVEMFGLDQDGPEEEEEELAAVKEMMFKVAAMQPVDIDPATVRRPRRRNVRISEDPQSVAARHRRERISEKIRILQRLVPGGTKMDTASMLEEAIRYVKFLKRQVRILQPAAPPSGEFSGGAYLFNGVNGHGAGGDVNIHPTCFD